jgi:hypothetical protein
MMSAELLRNNTRHALFERLKQQSEMIMESGATAADGVLRANIGLVAGLQEAIEILDQCYRDLNR